MTRILKLAEASLLAITSLSLLGGPQQAEAQYTNPYTFRNWNNPISNYLDVRIQQRMQERRLQERILEGQRAGDTAESSGVAESTPSGNMPAPALRRPISATDFRASGRRLLPATLAAATPDATAEEKDQLQTLYLHVLATFEEQARKNNVAYALTFLIGASMQVVRERELSDPETDRLAQELNDVLATSPEFRRLSPRQKQSMYEVAVITGGMIAVMYQIGVDQGNDELKKQAQETAREVITQLVGQ
jgi:hypothetical protein